MRQRPKEVLKNKADKMIDLIIDEIETGGVKNLTAGFTRHNLKYQIKVEVIVAERDNPENSEEPNINNSEEPNINDFGETGVDDEL